MPAMTARGVVLPSSGSSTESTTAGEQLIDQWTDRIIDR